MDSVGTGAVSAITAGASTGSAACISVFCVVTTGCDGALEHADMIAALHISRAGSPNWVLMALISKVDSPYLSVVFKSLADKLQLLK